VAHGGHGHHTGGIQLKKAKDHADDRQAPSDDPGDWGFCFRWFNFGHYGVPKELFPSDFFTAEAQRAQKVFFLFLFVERTKKNKSKPCGQIQLIKAFDSKKHITVNIASLYI
jgi:hypothetical protein